MISDENDGLKVNQKNVKISLSIVFISHVLYLEFLL